MKDKQQAIARAARFVRLGHGPMYVYRVGPAWMFTGESFEVVQAKYKVPVKEYQEIYAAARGEPQ